MCNFVVLYSAKWAEWSWGGSVIPDTENLKCLMSFFSGEKQKQKPIHSCRTHTRARAGIWLWDRLSESCLKWKFIPETCDNFTSSRWETDDPQPLSQSWDTMPNLSHILGVPWGALRPDGSLILPGRSGSHLQINANEQQLQSGSEPTKALEDSHITVQPSESPACSVDQESPVQESQGPWSITHSQQSLLNEGDWKILRS